MIDFNLKAFIAVAKMNSFTRAAKLLNLSQPAVTHQIKNLEQTLRTRLFVRSQSRISLTRSGEILLRHAEDINLLYQRAFEEIQEANSRVAGDVHIGAASLLGTYLLPKLLGEFKKSYPDVNVSMLVGNSKEILEYLRDDVIELAIVSEPISLPNFEVMPLYRDFLTVIVYPGHSWTTKNAIVQADLFDEDFISREVGSGTREICVKALELTRKGRTLRTVMVLGSTEAVKMAVIGKMGFSIVSRLAVRSEVELGLLREITVEDVTMARDFYAIYRSERSLSVPALRLKDFLNEKKEQFRQREMLA
jgi:DNA-binding transcriptional LysR family regulator